MQNISLIRPVVLEKKSFEWFLPYMGKVAILVNLDKIYKFSFPLCLEAAYEI